MSNLRQTFARQWLTGLAGLLLAAAVQAAPPDPQPAELVSTFRLPWIDGRAELDRFVDALGSHLDVNTRLFLMQWRRGPATGRTIDRDALDRLASASQGVVTFTAGDGELVVTIDRLQMRRREQELRTRLAEQAAGWFPEGAARVQAQYVVAIHRPDGVVNVLRDGDALPNQVVVLIHGLDDPGGLWQDLIPSLRTSGLTVAEVSYPNDQGIADSASFVGRQFADLRALGARQVRIVAHSMGGLVVRQLLAIESFYGGRADGYAAGPVIDRLILLGTPNYGSEMARLRLVAEARDQLCRAFSGDGLLFGGVFDGAGQAQQDLLPGSDFLRQLNARPLPVGVRLTVIAGQASPIDAAAVGRLASLLPGEPPESLHRFGQAMNSLASGLGDGCVSLDSARLAGVEDIHVVSANHLSMIRNVLPVDSQPPAIPIVLKTLQAP